jgi:Zn-dependent protease
MYDLTLLQKIVVYTIPILFAITVHEVAHGWVANRLGDPTARMLGRLTLNPIKHIDPIGTILVPALAVSLGGFLFGWAKPVPIGWKNLHHPRRDIALVAAAGPFANLLMAILWGLVIKLGIFLKLKGHIWAVLVIYMGNVGVTINLILMVLNLIPIPPLDGSRVMSSFLSPAAAYQYNKIEPYGFFILVALLMLGLLSVIMSPAVSWLQGTLYTILGL